MRIQKPCSTSGVITYSAGAIDSLWSNGNVAGSYSIAGVAKDGSFGWLAKGGALEVFNLKTGQRIAAWCFGALIRDPETLITAVCEFGNDCSTMSQLVIASTTLNRRVPGAIVCLFDVHRSAVVKAIQLPYEVTSLVTVSSVGPYESFIRLLCPQLQVFCGIVAVGTQSGHLYLLDMCTDDTSVWNELTPRQVQIVQPKESGIATLRNQAINKCNHLCFKLAGSSSEEEEHFIYWYSGSGSRPEHCQFKSSEVYVSCLHFVKQTLTLLVGYTFGGFQLWDLANATLKYSSQYEENMPAVIHFAFQEPENDPRDYCYVWVVHGPMSSDPVKSISSHASLYQLCYQNKKWMENFGFLYERLTSLAIRFSHELHLDPYDSLGSSECGSRVISCYTLEDHRFKSSPINANETLPDEGMNSDRSLCVFIWEAVPHDKQIANRCFLAIFDLNRWYHGQLPSSLSYYRNQRTLCPYWSVCSLNEVMQNTSPDLLLTAFVNFNELNRFFSPFNPQSEKFLYPSSLAFTVYCISDNGVIISKFLGIQRLILGYIQKNGFDVLLDPNEICAACVKSGLISTDSPDAKLTVMHRRELLLSMALDYSVVGFVLSCIDQLAKSEFLTEGMTLRTFLDWAWKKLTDCKESVDRLCVPLFDWSPVGFNEHDAKQLSHYQVLMQHLLSVFEALSACSSATTDQGKEEITARLSIVNLVSQYLDIIIWLHSVRLLPEHSEDDMLKGDEFAFPARTLALAYANRRQSIKQLNSDANPSAVLVIDGLLEAEGVSISKLFEDECGCCLYPPSSFHVVVSMFLLPDVTVQTKQMVMLYLLMDLAFNANSQETSRMQEICKQFCCRFRIVPSFFRHIQGIWLLDHQQFEQAAVLLLDANGSDYLGLWQHDFIIRAFLCQGYERLALKYITLKGIPALTADDVKLRMTVLLANGLTAEALKYQRAHHDVNLMDDLMSHLILACLETNMIGELLSLSLTKEEEIHLVQYLKNSGNPICHKLLVYYYLQQSRVTDAINFNGHRKSESVRGNGDRVFEAVIEGYKKVLPSVQHKMGFSIGSDHHFPKIYKEYSRPMPLSSELHHQQRDQVITRATLLNAVLDKVHQINFPDDHLLDKTTAGSEQKHQSFTLQKTSLFDTPVVPLSVKKSRMSVTNDVIFPSSRILEKPLPSFSSCLDSPQSLTSSVTNRLYSAAALTILQTPPVTKRRTTFILESTQKSPAPHSILSTKRLKLSTKASEKTRDVAGTLTFDDTMDSASDDQVRKRKTHLSSHSFDVTSTLKSKTLRFLEPEIAASVEVSHHDLSKLPPEIQTIEIPQDNETTAGEMDTNEGTGEKEGAVEDERAGEDEATDDDGAFATKAVGLASSSSNSKGENMYNSAVSPLPIPTESSFELTPISFSLGQESVRESTTAWLSSEFHLREMDVDDEKAQLDLSGEIKVQPSDGKVSSLEAVQMDAGADEPPPLTYSFTASSLRRPSLWQHDLWMQTSSTKSGPKPSSPSAKDENFGGSSGLTVCSDVGLQTSMSNESDGLELTPSQCHAELETKEDYISNKRYESNEIRSSMAKELNIQDPSDLQELAKQSLEIGILNTDSPSMHVKRLPSPRIFEDDKDVSDKTLKSPARRRLVRSPCREIIDPTLEYSKKDEKEKTVDQPKTPTRRRSLRSPHREIIDPTVENSGEDKKEKTVDQPKTPTRRRSLRSPHREIIDPTVENSEEDKKEKTVDQPKTPTRRRSVRSPGREVLNPPLENLKERENEEDTINQSKTPSRPLRSPGREMKTKESEIDPGDQPKTSTRIRSVRSPSRESATLLIEDASKDKEASVGQPRSRRTVRSPGREILEPLFEETSDVAKDLFNMSPRRSVQTPDHEVTEPLREKPEEAKVGREFSMRTRRSPSREIGDFTQKRTFEKESESGAGATVHLGSDNASEDTTASASLQRRFVRSPSRERIFIDNCSLTPVRRSLRQKEKHEKEQNVSGMEVNEDATPLKESSSSGKSTSRQEPASGKETGNQPLSMVSKSVALSPLKARKPVTRGDTKLVREQELQRYSETENVSVAAVRPSSSRSPGRSSKRRSVEREMIVETPLDQQHPSSSTALPSVDADMMENAASQEKTNMKSNEKTERRHFVFSAPLLATEIKDASAETKEVVTPFSEFVFSPPHTQLRDRLVIVPPVSPEAENVGAEEKEERKTAQSAKYKSGKTVEKIKTMKNKMSPSKKQSAVDKKRTGEDALNLLSPLSDTETAPKVSSVSVKKRSTRSSYVTRSKRKKLTSFDPPLFW